MPVRRIPKSHRSLTGLVAATKRAGPGTQDGMAGFESSLERDLLILLDFEPEVLSYEEQPVRIDYVDAEDGARHYTPDVLVLWHPNVEPALCRVPQLIEVKYRLELKKRWAELKPRFRAARRHARERGWAFRILTEVEIRTPYLRNVKFLSAYRRLQRDGAASERLLVALHERRATDPETLLSALQPDPGGRAALLPTLWELVAAGRVGIDLTLPLTMRSRLWWFEPGQGGTARCLPAWQRRLAKSVRRG
jgi:hypothetical protein